jgi:hypothetical protein
MMTLTIEDFRKKLRDIVGNSSMEGTCLRLNLLNTTIHTLPLLLQGCPN